MKTLDFNQMEKIEGGNAGCIISVIGLGFAFAGMFALGPVTGGATWVALISTTGGFIASGAGVGASCGGE